MISIKAFLLDESLCRIDSRTSNRQFCEESKMNLQRFSRLLVASVLFISAGAFSIRAQNGYSRAAAQPIDDEYTKKIREYTTETFFNSPLTDYLPASPNVPTPKAVLGDVSGAPGKLPYAEDVYRYMRMLEKASPRVKVFSIGTTEEGREMIAVAIASEQLLAKLDDNRARLAKLADPRTINSANAEAVPLVDQSFPSITSPGRFTRLRPARRRH